MGRDSDNRSYTSQLTIMVTDDVIGKSVECAHYDNNIATTIGSLNITVTGKLNIESLLTDHELLSVHITDALSLPTHYYNTSVIVNFDSNRRLITFSWGIRIIYL